VIAVEGCWDLLSREVHYGTISKYYKEANKDIEPTAYSFH
jgi:hypothetical protein